MNSNLLPGYGGEAGAPRRWPALSWRGLLPCNLLRRQQAGVTGQRLTRHGEYELPNPGENRSAGVVT